MMTFIISTFLISVYTHNIYPHSHDLCPHWLYIRVQTRLPSRPSRIPLGSDKKVKQSSLRASKHDKKQTCGLKLAISCWFHLIKVHDKLSENQFAET